MQIFIVNLFAIWVVKIETEKLSFHLVTLLSMQILSLQPQTLKLLRAENRSEGQTERGGYTGCQSLSRGVRTPTGSVWGWRTHGSMKTGKMGGHREWREEGQRRKDKDAATGGQTERLVFLKNRLAFIVIELRTQLQSATLIDDHLGYNNSFACGKKGWTKCVPYR